MLNNDQISSAVLFFVGVLIIIFSIPYEIGEIHAPGTGFLPFYTGVTICLLSILVFLGGSAKGREGKKWENPFKTLRWDKPLFVMAGLVTFVLILNHLGFILSSALLVGFLMRCIQPQKWSVVLVGAVFTSLVTYLVFQIWLGAQLPAGILSF
jgi:putative tricarboxylic transport membrane protein